MMALEGKQPLSLPNCLESEWFIITSTEKLNWEFSFLCELGAPYLPLSSLKDGSSHPTWRRSLCEAGRARKKRYLEGAAWVSVNLLKGEETLVILRASKERQPPTKAGVVVHTCNPNTQHKG